jgi:hypothetical protein
MDHMTFANVGKLGQMGDHGYPSTSERRTAEREERT